MMSFRDEIETRKLRQTYSSNRLKVWNHNCTLTRELKSWIWQANGELGWHQPPSRLQLRLQLLDRGAKFLAHKLTFNHNTRTLDVAQRVLEQSSNVSMAAAQVANSCPWCVITYNKQHASCFNTYT